MHFVCGAELYFQINTVVEVLVYSIVAKRLSARHIIVECWFRIRCLYYTVILYVFCVSLDHALGMQFCAISLT